MYRDTKYKRLEAGRFRLPVAIIGEGKRVVLISTAQLAMILEGIEPVVVKKRKRFCLQKSEAGQADGASAPLSKPVRVAH